MPVAQTTETVAPPPPWEQIRRDPAFRALDQDAQAELGRKWVAQAHEYLKASDPEHYIPGELVQSARANGIIGDADTEMDLGDVSAQMGRGALVGLRGLARAAPDVPRAVTGAGVKLAGQGARFGGLLLEMGVNPANVAQRDVVERPELVAATQRLEQLGQKIIGEPKNRRSFMDAFRSGDAEEVGRLYALAVAEQGPQYVAQFALAMMGAPAAAGAGIAALSAGGANLMDTDARADMSQEQKLADAGLTAAFEYLGERAFTVPWMQKIAARFKNPDVAKTAFRKGFAGAMARVWQASKAGAKPGAVEFVQEGLVTQPLQNAADVVTGNRVPGMTVWQQLRSGMLESGLVGAGAGGGAGSVGEVSVQGAQAKAQEQREVAEAAGKVKPIVEGARLATEDAKLARQARREWVDTGKPSDLGGIINTERQKADKPPIPDSPEAPAFVEVTPRGRAAMMADNSIRALGLTPVFVRATAGQAPLNAMIRGDKVYVNIESDAVPAAIGHEFAHYLKRSDPETYNAIREFILKKKVHTRLYSANVAEDARGAGIRLKPEDITEEYVGDVLGEYFMDPAFYADLAAQDIGAGRAFAKRIRSFMGKAQDRFDRIPTGKEHTDYNAETRKAIATAVGRNLEGRLAVAGKAQRTAATARNDAMAEQERAAEEAAREPREQPEPESAIVAAEARLQAGRDAMAREQAQRAERAALADRYKTLRQTWRTAAEVGKPLSEVSDGARAVRNELARKARQRGLDPKTMSLGQIIDALAEQEARRGVGQARFGTVDEGGPGEDMDPVWEWMLRGRPTPQKPMLPPGRRAVERRQRQEMESASRQGPEPAIAPLDEWGVPSAEAVRGDTGPARAANEPGEREVARGPDIRQPGQEQAPAQPARQEPAARVAPPSRPPADVAVTDPKPGMREWRFPDGGMVRVRLPGHLDMIEVPSQLQRQGRATAMLDRVEGDLGYRLTTGTAGSDQGAALMRKRGIQDVAQPPSPPRGGPAPSAAAPPAAETATTPATTEGRVAKALRAAADAIEPPTPPVAAEPAPPSPAGIEYPTAEDRPLPPELRRAFVGTPEQKRQHLADLKAGRVADEPENIARDIRALEAELQDPKFSLRATPEFDRIPDAMVAEHVAKWGGNLPAFLADWSLRQEPDGTWSVYNDSGEREIEGAKTRERAIYAAMPPLAVKKPRFSLRYRTPEELAEIDRLRKRAAAGNLPAVGAGRHLETVPQVRVTDTMLEKERVVRRIADAKAAGEKMAADTPDYLDRAARGELGFTSTVTPEGELDDTAMSRVWAFEKAVLQNTPALGAGTDPTKFRAWSSAMAHARLVMGDVARVMRMWQETGGGLNARDRAAHAANHLRAHLRAGLLAPPDGFTEMTKTEQDAVLARNQARAKKFFDKMKARGIDLDTLTDEQALDPVLTAEILREFAAEHATGEEKFYEAWINWGLLSNPVTHAVNITSTWAYLAHDFGLVRLTKAGIGAAIPSTSRSAEVPRFADYKAMLDNIGHYWTEAWRRARQTWETESSTTLGEPAGEKYGMYRQAIPGKAGRVARLPGRLMQWADEVPLTFVALVETQTHAEHMAASRGLTGAEADAFVRDEVSTPFSASRLYGANRAREVTFKLRPGQVASYISGMRYNEKLGVLRYPVKYMFPFIAVGSNLARLAARNAPVITEARTALGAVRLARAKTPAASQAAQAALVDRTARMMLGWGMVAALFQIVPGPDDDREREFYITGSGPPPRDRGRRDFAYRTARPYSIVVNGTQYDYARIAPVSNAVAFMVDGITAFKHAETGKRGTRVLNRLMQSMATQVKDQTFLQTVGDIADAWSEAENTSEGIGRSAERVLSRFGASFMPGIARAVVRNRRDSITAYVNDRDAAPHERIMANIARDWGLSRAFPRVDVWGNDIANSFDAPSYGAVRFWLRMGAPVPLRDDAPMDMADRFLWNWNRRPENATRQWFPIPPQNSMKVGDEYVSMSPETLHAYAQESGRTAHDAIIRAIQAGALSPNNPTARQLERYQAIMRRARARIRPKYRERVKRERAMLEEQEED